MPHRRNHHLCFEKLESRQMMAGNITVAFNNSIVLTIFGDSENNSFSIARGNTANEIVITGLPSDDQLNPNTTINNQSQITITGVNPAQLVLEVELLDGNDSMYVSKITCVAIDFSGNDGDDLFQIGTYVPLGDPNPSDNYHTFTGNMVLRGGLEDFGNDTYNINRLYGNPRVRIDDAEGVSNVKTYVAFLESIEVVLGSENDVVDIGYLTSDRFTAFTKDADDLVSVYASHIVSDASIQSGAGSDFVALDVNQFDNARIIIYTSDDHESAIDTVLFSRSVLDANSPIYEQIQISTGEGDDIILIGKYYDYENGDLILRNGGSSLTHMRVDAGPGVDNIYMAANVLSKLLILLGTDEDTLEMESNLVSQEFTLYADFSFTIAVADGARDVFRRKNNSFDVAGNTVSFTDYGIDQNVFY